MSELPEVVDAVVLCMQRHDANPKVFSKGCGVLWKLSHELAAVKVCTLNKAICSSVVEHTTRY